MILASCQEQLERIRKTLGTTKDPTVFHGNVSQFLEGDCSPKEDEITLLGRLQSESNSLIKFIFASEFDMARVVGVGIPNTIVTLERDTM